MQFDGSEEWRQVLGYEGLYSISSLGRVRSEARVVKHSSGGAMNRRERLLKVSPGSPYPAVQLCKQGRINFFTVHILVLEAFVGPRPNGMEGCHNDSDPTNCTLGTLRWDTRGGNFSDMIGNGTRRRGVKHHLAKLTAEQVHAIRADQRLHKLIAAEHGVSVSNISAIKSAKSWEWLPHSPRPCPSVSAN